MPAHTLILVFGSWLLLAAATALYLVRTRPGDGEDGR